MHTLKLFTLKLLKMLRHVSIILSSSGSCLFLAKITLLKIFTDWFSYNSLVIWQHVVLCRSSDVRSAPDCPSPDMFTNLTRKRTDMSWIPYLPVRVTKCDLQLSNLRQYWEQSHVLTLISVLLSLDKTVASNHMLHRVSPVHMSDLHASVTKRNSQLSNLREYWEKSHVLTLISVLLSLDKTVASNHMLHKQSVACSCASYS